MTVEVWKLQWPLGVFGRDSDQQQPLMAYTEQRRRTTLIPPTKQLAEMFAGAAKIYVEAEIEGGALMIYRRVADRSW